MMQIPILCQLVTNQRQEQHPRDQHEFEMQNRAEIRIIRQPTQKFDDSHFSNQMNINYYLHSQR